MEKISFALGVASVLVVLLGAITVWVTLKVNRLISENRNLQLVLHEIERSFSQRVDDTEHHYSDEIKEVYNTIHNRVDEIYRLHRESHDSLIRGYDRLNEELMKRHDDCLRYTDSRIDKLMNNPKFCLNKEKELLTD